MVEFINVKKNLQALLMTTLLPDKFGVVLVADSKEEAQEMYAKLQQKVFDKNIEK